MTTTTFSALSLVRLDQVVAHVVEQAYDDVVKAMAMAGTTTTEGREGELEEDGLGLGLERKAGRRLAVALMTARQKLSRLDILMQWASLKWEASVQCARMLAACAEEEQALVAAADQLAYLHSELLHTRTPLFDVCRGYGVLVERRVSGLMPKVGGVRYGVGGEEGRGRRGWGG